MSDKDLYFIVKLKNNTEVVGKIIEIEESGLTLEDPFIINYMMNTKNVKPFIALFRYMPFIESRMVFFKQTDIQNVGIARNSFVKYYQYILKHFKETIDDEIDSEMMTLTEEPDDGDIEKIYNTLLKNVSSNSNFH